MLAGNPFRIIKGKSSGACWNRELSVKNPAGSFRCIHGKVDVRRSGSCAQRRGAYDRNEDHQEGGSPHKVLLFLLLAQMFEYTSTGQSRHPAPRVQKRFNRRIPESICSRKFRWYDLCVSSRRGKFITFEGLDGSGKSTQLERLAGKLREQGLSVVVTREPGGTAAGEKIRELLLDTRTSGLAPMAELALMFASRAQHVHEIILPGLNAAQIVLCDRFTDSSEAYQGGGRKLGSKPVLGLHRALCGDMKPDLTILMDSDVGVSVERARRRNQARSNSEVSDEGRFERENHAFFTRVRNAYLEIAKREPERVFVVDARGTPDQTHAKILQIVSRKLGLEVASRKANHVR